MLEYAHFVPGRLRLQISQLKHRSKAAEAEVYVSAIPGVRSAAANYAIGSLTINFDRDRLALSELWARLAKRGYVTGPCPEPAMTGSVFVDHPGAVRIGRAVMTAFIEAIAQHSAQAIVRALL
jgi:hypothetical protein